jgi:hypothetical protein
MFFSFPGSESSTSDGITKTFATAKAAAAAAGPGTIAVVLLDEVGLAEISPHNPLKVQGWGTMQRQCQYWLCNIQL